MFLSSGHARELSPLFTVKEIKILLKASFYMWNKLTSTYITWIYAPYELFYKDHVYILFQLLKPEFSRMIFVNADFARIKGKVEESEEKETNPIRSYFKAARVNLRNHNIHLDILITCLKRWPENSRTRIISGIDSIWDPRYWLQDHSAINWMFLRYIHWTRSNMQYFLGLRNKNCIC